MSSFHAEIISQSKHSRVCKVSNSAGAEIALKVYHSDDNEAFRREVSAVRSAAGSPGVCFVSQHTVTAPMLVKIIPV